MDAALGKGVYGFEKIEKLHNLGYLPIEIRALPEGTLVTYEMLQRFGVDSVVFTKHGDLDYSVDFAEIGTYEQFHGIEEEDAE